MEQIRKKIGLSQREFSQLLGISRSSLMSAELGRYLIPGPALEKMMRLELALEATSPAPPPGNPRLEKFLQHCQTAERDCRYYIMKAEREMEKAAKQYENNCRLYQGLLELRKNDPAPLLTLLQDKAERKIGEAWVLMEKLQRRLHVLQAELLYLQGYLEKHA